MSDKILLGHGGGGRMMQTLIHETIGPVFGEKDLQLDDSAVLPSRGDTLAFTSDSYTITPLVFPGGDIGSLAVNGTVNDLAVMGAEPAVLSCALIIEEGLEVSLLKRILMSMKSAADGAGVSIVTGDTKVVERGQADKLFINTSGIGFFRMKPQRHPIRAGDRLVINGTIGDHGITVMARRSGLSFSRGLLSDCASLNRLIGRVTERHSGVIRFMRDATRGGVAAIVNELVSDTSVGVELFEKDIPIKPEVSSVCEILGIDPLYAANEGKVLMAVSGDAASDVVATMRLDPLGRRATIIGRFTDEHQGMAYVKTRVGGKRMLPMLMDTQLPRIC